MDVSVECLIISPWSCDTWIMCVCVCERVCVSEALLKEMKDILMTWTAASGGGWWRLINIVVFFFFSFFFCACMYEELPPQLDQFSHQWTNAGQACVPFLLRLLLLLHYSTPCLPVNGHPSDCQGISQVQLTLTYFTCVVWGSISSPFGVSYGGNTRTSLEYCHSFYGCWVSHTFPLFFFSLLLPLIRSQNGQLPLHFLAVL